MASVFTQRKNQKPNAMTGEISLIGKVCQWRNQRKNSAAKRAGIQKRSFLCKKISETLEGDLMPLHSKASIFFCRSSRRGLRYRFVEILKLIDRWYFSFTPETHSKINHPVRWVNSSKPLIRGLKHIK